MNPRLTRPLLAIAISGALFTGGAVVASPAFAQPGGASAGAPAALADPTDDPTEPTPTPTPTETETAPEPTPTPTETASEPDPTPTPTETASEPDPTGTASEPVPDPTGTVTEPAPDTTAPVGGFTLNTASLWVGQLVSLTQGTVTDNESTASQITRTVTWGDGTSSILPASTSPFRHKYTGNGRFTVTVTLTDAAGNAAKATAPNSAVTVTTPGKFKLSKYSVWNAESFTLTISAVPAGTTRLALNWGDGWITNLKPKNQTVRGLFYHHKNTGAIMKGAVTLRTTFANKYGDTLAIYSGKVTIKNDSWKPVVKVKKPGSSNRIKSWKTVYGTATDKGSGTPEVFVWGTRFTGSKVYCTNSKKKWLRVYSDADFDRCTPIRVKVTKGKWSMKLPGVAKGTLYVDARTWDWADNASKWSTVKAKITRS